VDGDFASAMRDLASGGTLDRAAAASALAPILRGEVDDAAITEFLVALTHRACTATEMAGFVDAMMAAATSIDGVSGAMDVVGTGGDRLGTVNISTMAAITVAACGVPVAKHGNRAASSAVGTADVLEGLGVKIDVDGSVVARCVREAGIGFCFAQRFHPGLRYLGPIRRKLGVPTVFNLLGPLANPAHVTRLVIGVADELSMEPMANVLQLRGVQRAALVHGDDGLDELSLGAPSTVVDVTEDTVARTRFDPETLGSTRHDVKALTGGSLDVNVRAVRDYLAGRGGAVADTVAVNAGLALVVAGRAGTVSDGRDLAVAAVRDGRAAQTLQALVELSNG
jgi:anthranilate phosphoribosyltransferase